MRSLPLIWIPLGAVTRAVVPGLSRPSSAEVTSARHSSRPWRIMRNSSVPLASTAPTVALRDEMTPLSGANTWVFVRRNCCAPSNPLAASTRALAVCSEVWYWLICCVLKAPLFCSVRARSALPAASAALASASTRLARACARSAWMLSGANTASTCPARTTSPTLAFTCVRRKPLDSAPMLASCQAAMLPLAVSLTDRRPSCGLTVVMVKAGFGAAFFLSSAASDVPASSAVHTTANAAVPVSAAVLCLDKKRFMVVGPMV